MSKHFIAKIKFADIREVLIEADSMEEAEAKYAAGEWAAEDTVDFYSEEELSPLTEKDNPNA